VNAEHWTGSPLVLPQHVLSLA